MKLKKLKSDRSLRPKLRSPGRPPVLHRAERWPFWKAIAEGHTSEDAAAIAGVAPAVGTRWFRQCGGMPPSNLAPSAPEPTGRYLAFSEREQIALARVRGEGVREIARQLGRSPSTISRELRRNARNARGRPRVPCPHCTVACRPRRDAPEAGQIADEPDPARVRSGSAVRQHRDAWWPINRRTAG